MRLASALALLAASTLSAAQNFPPISASVPTSIPLGSTFTVTVQQGRGVGISAGGQLVITLGGSLSGPGVVLFNGEFDPMQTIGGTVQDITVTVPSQESTGFVTGPNILSMLMTAVFTVRALR
ncbi:hypothetical protein EIP86_011085 [Pleurotus ostreatoroseus]|nr:hypothetical protein EIP86_011085 [Pleurotus ostreatoroseus]